MSNRDRDLERRPSDVPITQRTSLRRSFSDGYIDRLLTTSASIEPGVPVELGVSTLLDVAVEALPGVSVGVCMVTPQGQVTLKRAVARRSEVMEPDPSRLFPEHTNERIISIEFDRASTLHLGSDDETGLEEEANSLFADRLSLAVGSVMRHARAYEAANSASAELRGLEARIIQSEKLASLGQISAGIVHEINNPLTSIIAYTEMLKKSSERRGADAVELDRLERVNEAAQRILRFARDLIEYARPSAGVPATVDVHEVLARSLGFCEHVLARANVVVTRNFEATTCVRGISGQLAQVFVNLFTNACDAMEGGGALWVSTTDDGETVTIRIEDDGSGIPEEHLDHIFEPFFTTKQGGGGTGLGLSIVHDIVVGHGGTIDVERRSPRGTTFRIVLPASAAESEG